MQKNHNKACVNHLLLLILVALIPVPILASEAKDELCSAPVYQPQTVPAEQHDNQTHIQADHVSLSKENTSIFSCNVDSRRNDQFISADKVEFQQKHNYLHAHGQVEFRTSQIKINANKAEFHIDDDKGILDVASGCRRGLSGFFLARLDSATRFPNVGDAGTRSSNLA